MQLDSNRLEHGEPVLDQQPSDLHELLEVDDSVSVAVRLVEELRRELRFATQRQRRHAGETGRSGRRSCQVSALTNSPEQHQACVEVLPVDDSVRIHVQELEYLSR